MAANLTDQVRGIVKVVTAVAHGDLDQKLTVEAKGEVAALAETINNMTATLAIFADQVTTVAREVGVEGRLGGQANVPGADGTWKDLTANVNLLAANLTTQVRAIAEVATAVTQGDLTRSIQVDVRGEVADLKDNINAMIGNLRATTERNTEQDWLKTNLAEFGRMMQGQRDLITVGDRLLSELAPLIGAQQGVMYVMEGGAAEGGQPLLRQLASYADLGEGDAPRRYRIGEGLVGQCAKERQRILLANLPQGSIRIASGLLASPPRTVIVLPVLFEGQVKAVLELASLGEFTASHLAFLEQLTGSIGIVFNTIEATMRTEGLLKSSQQLAGELQDQQKELQLTNEELARKAQLLAQQNAEVERKNQEIEQARRAVEEKAAELVLTSRYKSEFLANMSHELRTPLNSILILGQQLAENPDQNLSERQVEFAKTIHDAGTDLLNLIQDILDLSKIESGTVTVESEVLLFEQLRGTVERGFKHEAEGRGLEFSTEFAAALGRVIVTDPKRLLQVLKNLLSNAFKFTERGSVRLDVSVASDGWTPDHPVLARASSVVAFAVSDTGIGIAPDKQRIVFEAFQQADAGTARKYGGTGLGLAISRELARLLGGEIRLQSTVGRGSTFTLFLPSTYLGPASRAAEDAPQAAAELQRGRTLALPVPGGERVEDDRSGIQPADAVLLLVEGDPNYARALLKLARSRGFKGLVALPGAEALALAREFHPVAISLDVCLPDMSAWTMLSQLKHDPVLRQIPVHLFALDEQRQHGLERGACSCLRKPVTREDLEAAFERIRESTKPRKRELLLVAEDSAQSSDLVALLDHDDLELTAVGSSAAALAILRQRHVDCVVLGLLPSEVAGFELLERMDRDPSLQETRVVVFTRKELTGDEELRVRSAAKSVVLKCVHSPERLLDETTLFLHRSIASLRPAQQQMLQRLHQTDVALAGKLVLVVDDDVRNIFALSSYLERRGMRVLSATSGREAIHLVEQHPDLSLVLMDIMMPEMDGCETIQRMRQQPRLQLLPIIALTARAMKGDREKCLEAGASDYIAKPVNTAQLTALLRAWLHR
jgi:signal transduction histidine kinase/CheY-like chemotaxis protein/HAMP domain-containing protein